MKVLIVARTRQGGGACVGGIGFDGRSVRLIAPHGAHERWGLEFDVGAVWEIEGEPPESVTAPHVENLVVRARRRLGPMTDPAPFIERHMAPAIGGPETLYGGLLQSRSSGALYVAERTGVPPYSTCFWRPDRPLSRSGDGKRIRYHYTGDEAGGDRSLVFVGFQEPAAEVPAGALVRVSLAHWWRPAERPDEEMRCFVQLSGWFDAPRATARARHLAAAPTAHVAPAPPAPAVAAAPAPTPHDPPGETSCPAAAAPPPTTDAPATTELPAMSEARAVLSRVFGFHAFRPLQEEIIARVLAGRDCLGVMPTGAGKSLCFHLPALVLNGLTVVVSPLVALMQDQVDQLRELGVPAVTLNSSLAHAEYVAATARVRSGEARLLYVAPETLLRPEMLLLLDEGRVRLITVDEAHCISEWGHDFRPEYRQLRTVRQRYPGAVCLALTATATERVRADIRASLGIAAEDTFVAPFDRPNLHLEVRRRGDGFQQVLRFLAAREGESGILYCATREQVDTLAARLADHGIGALPYHAGMDDADRRLHQRRFLRDDAPLIVATVAFGMGINKSNVRFVIHHALPDSLETYYQQVGRAGRDGLRADCLLLYGRSDVATAYHFIEQAAPAEQAGRSARLHAMVRYAEARACRRVTLLPYFGDAAPDAPCGMCDNCVSGADGRTEVDVSEEARRFLACVEQTRQRFGPAHVVEVLRGSRSARVLQFRHDRLPAHGTGAERSKAWWRQLADRLIEAGVVEADMEHGTLRITAAGREVVEGKPLLVVMDEPAVAVPPAGPAVGERACDPALFAALRRLRRGLADEADVPAFVIFSDRSLGEMAAAMPRTMAEFLRIHGVGDRKAAAYGEPFLEVIRDHLRQSGGEKAHGADEPPGPSRTREVAEGFAAGRSVADLQRLWAVQRETILNHLVAHVRDGGHLDPERLLAECSLEADVRERALTTLEALGDVRLAPVFEALGGAVPYPELRLLRLYRACRV